MENTRRLENRERAFRDEQETWILRNTDKDLCKALSARAGKEFEFCSK